MNGTISIHTNVTAPNGVNIVEFYIDGNKQSTDNSYPSSFNWDTTNYANGTHFVKVVVYNNAGLEDQDEVMVKINN